MTNTLIHSHSSLENHTPFRTKLGNIYTLFQAGTVQLKIIPFGVAQTYVAHLYKKVLPGLCKRLFFKIFPSRKKNIHCKPDKINSHQFSNAPEPPLPGSFLTRSHNITHQYNSPGNCTRNDEVNLNSYLK